MNCPVDNSALETHPIGSIEVDECRHCHGLWFAQGELRRVKDESDADLNWLDFDIWSDQDALDVIWSSRKCPQCGKNMASIKYADTGVTIDYCTQEHGVWLDKGEFETIISALKKETLTKTLPEYIAASLEEAVDLITGEESFISEWKDLLTVTRLLQYRVLADNPKLAQALVALAISSPF